MVSAKELYLSELCSEYETLLQRFRESDLSVRAELENLAARLRLYGIMADPDDRSCDAVKQWQANHAQEERERSFR
jgi:hypothetical protein